MEKLLVYTFVFGGLVYIALGDYCSKLGAKDITSCKAGNGSKEDCLTNGCCWNETKANAFGTTRVNTSENSTICYRSRHLNGTCMDYPETGTCNDQLNTSALEYRETPRFIDYNIGFNETNNLLKIFQDIISVVAKDVTPICVTKINRMLCQYVLTPCAEDGSPLQICRQDCESLERECPATLQKLLGAARLRLTEKQADFQHLLLPECKNLHSKEELAKQGKTCYRTGIFADIESQSKAESKTTLIIIIAVVLACVLLIAIISLVFYRRRKRAAKSSLDPGTPSMTFRQIGTIPSLSIKDHINQLTADDLLKSKMLIKDIKEIKQYPVDMVAYERDLGEGQFGQVFQGRAVGLDEEYPEEEVVVAVKTLKKGSSLDAKEEFEQETLLMNFLHHPNIVQLLAVSAMEEPYCMIFEFMSKGDLSEFLRNSEFKADDDSEPTDSKKTQLTEEMLIKMCVDVAKGLQFLASNRLIHRDVATRNCLVSDDLTIKIADFGMSRDIYSSNYYKVEKETVLPIRWLAPEAVLFGKFTVETDIYAYGVLLWEVFTFSMQPYYGYTNKEVLDFIRQGIHLGQPDICPDFIYKLMKACWAMEPDQRPAYQAILNRLEKREETYDIPNPSREKENLPDDSLYQNIPSFQTEASEDEPLNGGHSDDLSPAEASSRPTEAAEDGIFQANNPLFGEMIEQDQSSREPRSTSSC